MPLCCNVTKTVESTTATNGQVGDANVDGSGQGVHGMTGSEWRVATALFTAGEVSVIVLTKGHCYHISRHIAALQAIFRLTIMKTGKLQKRHHYCC